MEILLRACLELLGWQWSHAGIVTASFTKQHRKDLMPPAGAVSKRSLNRGLIAPLSLITEQGFLGMLPPE